MDKSPYPYRFSLSTVRIVVATALTVGGMALQADTPPEVAKARPNVLFIAVDDLKPTLGSYGDRAAITPNLDTLAASGILFDNAHCQQAVCTASRASLLTGLYPDTVQIWDLDGDIRQAQPDAVTLPQYFRQVGYQTAAVGKIFDKRNVDDGHDAVSWSRPHRSPSMHTEFQYGAPEHYAAMEALERDGNLPENRIPTLKKQGLLPPVEAVSVDDERYPDAQIATLGIEALQELSASEEPFFLAVGFLRPHLPFAAPQRYWDLYERDRLPVPQSDGVPDGSPYFAFQDSWELRWSYSGVPPAGTALPPTQQKEMIHGYYACVSFVDEQVGRLLEALDASGLRDRTIIVLWGDHGWHLGDHGMWGKHTNFEQATRTPLLLAGPGIPYGVATDQPVELIDLYPTLCALAGIPAPNAVEGVSLLPLLEKPEKPIRFAAQSQFPREDQDRQLMGYSWRSDRYRYTEWRDRQDGTVIACELFDYVKDPEELTNHIDDPAYAEVLEQFRTQAVRGGAP